MLLFRSEEHIDRWCAAWRLPRGAILTLETGWRLAPGGTESSSEFHGSTTTDDAAVNSATAPLCFAAEFTTWRDKSMTRGDIARRFENAALRNDEKSCQRGSAAS